MTAPDPAYEKKVLLAVVEQIKDVERTMRKQRALKRGAVGVGALGMTLAFFQAINGLAHPVIVAFVAGMSGCALGFAYVLTFAQRQWPITQKYVDLERVRKRLAALDGPGAAETGSRDRG